MSKSESKKGDNKAFDELMNEQAPGVYQLAPGLTGEEMLAVFFNEDALVEAPQKVYRLNGTNHRYYYTFDEKLDPTFFTSVTTMIKQTMPTSPHLIKWVADMGYDESKNYAQERANYGTFMHIEIAELLIAKRYDTDKLKAKLKAYIEAEQLPVAFINYEEELKNDVMAFAQFMIEKKVKPIAIEVVLTHPADGYAGAIDLVCEITENVSGYWGEVYKSGVNKDKPKLTKKEMTFLAIIDFKSGRKGFYESHEVQLQAYMEMWQHHYPGKKVERIYSWAPKAWRGATPTYSFKDQTEAKSRDKLKHLVEIARIEDARRNNTVQIVNGVIDVEQGLEGNITEMTLSELVKKRAAEKDTPNK